MAGSRKLEVILFNIYVGVNNCFNVRTKKILRFIVRISKR